MRPTCELPYCASEMSASPSMAHGMLVAHSSSSPKWRYTNWCRSSRYCSSCQLCLKAGVTSSISDSEKSVVMCSLVSAEPSAAGCGVCARCPSGATRSDSFSTPLSPPCSTCGSPLLMSAARRLSKTRSMARLLTPSPAHAAAEHLEHHPQVAGQTVERMRERCGSVFLEDVVAQPCKAVAGDRYRCEQCIAAARERRDEQRHGEHGAAHVQPARGAVGVLAQIERVEVAKARVPRDAASAVTRHCADASSPPCQALWSR